MSRDLQIELTSWWLKILVLRNSHFFFSNDNNSNNNDKKKPNKKKFFFSNLKFPIANETKVSLIRNSTSGTTRADEKWMFNLGPAAPYIVSHFEFENARRLLVHLARKADELFWTRVESVRRVKARSSAGVALNEHRRVKMRARHTRSTLLGLEEHFRGEDEDTISILFYFILFSSATLSGFFAFRPAPSVVNERLQLTKRREKSLNFVGCVSRKSDNRSNLMTNWKVRGRDVSHGAISSPAPRVTTPGSHIFELARGLNNGSAKTASRKKDGKKNVLPTAHGKLSSF